MPAFAAVSAMASRPTKPTSSTRTRRIFFMTLQIRDGLPLTQRLGVVVSVAEAGVSSGLQDREQPNHAGQQYEEATDCLHEQPPIEGLSETDSPRPLRGCP